ncbi:MAG: YraN family protein [Candidatus Kerfeldbacteria bacterium]|nr:YraN family protein [Candidatus Kerfeldbacteria bacterium]
MAHARQQLGRAGEAAAVDYLKQLGYSILDTNWHAGRYGELDIIAQEGQMLVVVEVKARRGFGFGRPEDSVTPLKQNKLRSATQAYVLSHPHLPTMVRFDVLAIILSPEGIVQDLQHYQGLNF